MSSNPKSSNIRPSKRMTSIANRIMLQISRTKLSLYFKMDLLIFILLNAGWAYMKEIERAGDFVLKRNRCFVTESGSLRDLLYLVYSADGELLLSVGFFRVLFVTVSFVSAVFVLQFLGVLLSLPAVSSRARRTLSPIREIAEKADELNRLAFSEDKYSDFLFEMIMNAVEEFQIGESTEITVKIMGDTYEIIDDGSGIGVEDSKLLKDYEWKRIMMYPGIFF